jgi:prepilin-type N-terminal cleavage/methylation domain-containing protein
MTIMKHHLSRRRRGLAFTLVELLVVMGIIAILVGVVIAGVSSAIRFAKRTKANALAVNIQTAVQSYYTEYGIYPVAGTVTIDDYYDGVSNGAKWQNLMFALCGNTDPYSGSTTLPSGSIPPNTRNIVFLTPTRSDIDATFHTPRNPFTASVSGTFAPYFYMVVDSDYSGIVGDSSTTKIPDFSGTNYTGTTLPKGLPGGVVVWSSSDQPTAGGTAAKPSNPAWWAHTY